MNFWNSANSLFRWRFQFVVIQLLLSINYSVPQASNCPWQVDYESLVQITSWNSSLHSNPVPLPWLVLRLLVCLVLLLFPCSNLVKDKTCLIKKCSWQTSSSELPWLKMSLSLAQISLEKKDVRQFWRYSWVKKLAWLPNKPKPA